MALPSVTANEQRIQTVYADLMGEAKARLSWIRFVIGGESKIDPVVGAELCALQVRLIIELIALGCLLAHGDIKATQSGKLQKSWSPEAILDGLEALHPAFFPTPQTMESQGTGRWHFGEFVGPALSKADLLGLYGKTNDALHRGSLKNVLTGKRPLTPDYAAATAACDQLQSLLWVHRISMLDPATQFVCVLHNGDGMVQTFFAKATG